MKTIFFDVDTQNDFIHPKGALPVPKATSLLKNFQRLTNLALKKNITILSSVDRLFGNEPELKRMGGPWPDHCLDGTWGQKKVKQTLLKKNVQFLENKKYSLQELEQISKAKQIIIEKQSYNPFDNLNTKKIIQMLTPERVFIYGVATDYCVQSVTREFLKIPTITTYLVIDAVKGIDEEESQKIISDLVKQGLRLVSTDFLENRLLINYAFVKKRIINWLKEKTLGTNGLVVGLSGGIDSSVAATLAVEALGNKKVFGLIMPTSSTPKQDLEDALTLAKKLKIQTKILPLDSLVEDLVKTIKIQSIKAIGNLKARLRMTLLYGVANEKNALVLGTGDRSEILIGYFTKFGDGGVDFLPLGDLYKTQVYELGEFLGLPKSILKKEPSPALWTGQSAASEIGISYDQIDLILYHLFEQKPRKINLPYIEKKQIAKIINLFETSKHKREMPSICKFLKP